MQSMLTKYFIVLILIMLAHSANSVHAALLTEVTFNQELRATDRQSGTQYSSLPFAGNTIPAHGSRALGAPYGGFIGADYDFTDTGSIAIFDINVLYTVKDWDAVSAQSPDGNLSPILFTATQPLFYTISVSHFVLGATDTPSTATFAVLDGGSGNVFDIRLRTNDPSTFMSGSLPSSTSPYSFLTLIQGGVSSGSGILSGNGHIVLTLTSVPISGSYLMMMTGLATMGLVFCFTRRSSLVGR